MHKDYGDGFSLIKFLLIFFAVLAVIIAGVAGTYSFLKQQHTAEAQQFVQDFVSDIEKGDPQITYNKFSPSLKGTEQQTTYLTWLFWVRALTSDSDKLVIDQSENTISYNENSFIDVFKADETIRFTYKTSGPTSVYFEVKKQNNEWVLNNYATL